jgi:hypothetical protein
MAAGGKKESKHEAPEVELAWWFQEMAGLLGQHGSGFEGSGAMSWDAKAIGRLFDKVLDDRTEAAVKKYARILPIMQALGPERREVGRLLYEPRSMPDAYAHLEGVWPPIVHGPKVCRVSAIAVVMHTSAAREAFARAHGGKPAESSAQLLGWASDAIRPRVSKGRTINQEKPKWASVAMSQAVRLGEWIVEEYDGIVASREKAKREVKAQEERAEVARLRRVFA